MGALKWSLSNTRLLQLDAALSVALAGLGIAIGLAAFALTRVMTKLLGGVAARVDPMIALRDE